MTSSAKRRTLIFLGLVMIITVIIAASLPQLTLQPGMPLPRLENSQLVITSIDASPMVTITISKFAKILLALFLAGSIIYVIYRLTRGLDWRNLATYLQPIMLSLTIVGILLLLVSLLLSEPKIAAPVDQPYPTATPLPTSPLGPVPPLLPWLVGIGLLIFGSWLGFSIFSSSSERLPAIDLVGLEAEKAWQAIRTGQNLKGVIIQCYRQMSLALEQEQGLEREEWMTTREFEILLETAGMPHEPVHQLTQLFEAVRYGDWQPNPADEQKAFDCLQAIMSHSVVPKKPD